MLDLIWVNPWLDLISGMIDGWIIYPVIIDPTSAAGYSPIINLSTSESDIFENSIEGYTVMKLTKNHKSDTITINEPILAIFYTIEISFLNKN